MSSSVLSLSLSLSLCLSISLSLFAALHCTALQSGRYFYRVCNAEGASLRRKADLKSKLHKEVLPEGQVLEASHKWTPAGSPVTFVTMVNRRGFVIQKCGEKVSGTDGPTPLLVSNMHTCNLHARSPALVFLSSVVRLSFACRGCVPRRRRIRGWMCTARRPAALCVLEPWLLHLLSRGAFTRVLVSS